MLALVNYIDGACRFGSRHAATVPAQLSHACHIRAGVLRAAQPGRPTMSTTHATTLSPSAAILWAYRFADDGTAEPVPVTDVDDALATRGGRFWIHAALADTRCRFWLEHHAPLSVAARDVLLGPAEHLHVNVMPDEIAGVL